MATAQDIIDSALRLLNITATGETPTALERADGLITLNQMLSSWSAQGVMIPYVTGDSFALTGAGSYTIGTGSTINTARPLLIRAMSIMVSNVRKDLEIVKAERWAQIRDLSRASKFARLAYFEVINPTVGAIYLWPTPASGGLLTIHSLKPLTAFGALSTPVSMPEGYERALRALLALELAPEYGAPVTETLIAMAQDAKGAIAGLNAAVLGPPVQAAPQEPAA